MAFIYLNKSIFLRYHDVDNGKRLRQFTFKQINILVLLRRLFWTVQILAQYPDRS